MKHRFWLKAEGAMIPWRCVLLGHRFRDLYSGGLPWFCARRTCTWSAGCR